MIIEAAGPQEGAVRRAVETLDGNARAERFFGCQRL